MGLRSRRSGTLGVPCAAGSGPRRAGKGSRPTAAHCDPGGPRRGAGLRSRLHRRALSSVAPISPDARWGKKKKDDKEDDKEEPAPEPEAEAEPRPPRAESEEGGKKGKKGKKDKGKKKARAGRRRGRKGKKKGKGEEESDEPPPMTAKEEKPRTRRR